MEAALEKALVNPGLGLALLDDSNKGLAREVEELRMKVLQARDDLNVSSWTNEQTSGNVEDMTQMLKYMQDLLLSYQSDFENTTKLARNTNGEVESVTDMCSRIHAEINSVKEAVEQLSVHLTLGSREAEELQKGLQGDGSLLKELLEHLADADGDHLLLLQYSAADASIMKDLSISLEKASSRVATLNADLHAVRCESGAASKVLVQLGSMFVAAAAQRDQLLSHWEVTLQHIYCKASQQAGCVEDMVALQKQVNHLQREVKYEQQILSQVKISFEEVETKLNEKELEAISINIQLVSAKEMLEGIEAQFAAQKTSRINAEKEIEFVQNDLCEQQQILKEKNLFVTKLETQCEKATERLSLNSDLLMTAEEGMREVEMILKESEMMLMNLQTQKQKMSEYFQHYESEFLYLKNSQFQIKGEIVSSDSTKTRNLNHLKLLHQQMDKQKETIHNQELNLLDLRRHLHQLTHDSNNNKQLNVDQQLILKRIQHRLKQVSSAVIFISKQLKDFESCRNQEKFNLEFWSKETEISENKIICMKRCCDQAEREMSRLKREREENGVDASLTQIHLRHRLVQLQNLNDKVNQLNSNKSNMETLVNEQSNGVSNRTMQLTLTMRDLQSEIHEYKLKLFDVCNRIKQLKERYSEIKSCLIASNGEEESETLVMLKVEGEKSGLQQTGDILDGEIRTAEHEIEALRQIVALVSEEENQYRSHIQHIMKHSREHEVVLQLQETKNVLNKEICVWEDLHKQMRTNLERGQTCLCELELQVRAVEGLLREKSVHLNSVEREFESQKIATNQAMQATNGMIWRTRNRGELQTDIELRLIQERLRVVNVLLGEALSLHNEAIETCVSCCMRGNIPPPDVPRFNKHRGSSGSRSSIGTLASSRSGCSATSARSMKSPETFRSIGSIASSRDSEVDAKEAKPVVEANVGKDSTQISHFNVVAPTFPVRKTKAHSSSFLGKKFHRRPSSHC